MTQRLSTHSTLTLLLTLIASTVRAESWSVDTMTDKSRWVLAGQRHDFSLGTSKLEVAKTPSRPGVATVLKLTCDFDKRSWVGIQWRGGPLVGRPEHVPFWMHGDSSGHKLVAGIEDAAGRIYQAPLSTIDFQGWREIEVPTDPGKWTPVRRQGDPESPVHWPVSLRELRVVKVGSQSLSATVAFSELRATGNPRPIERVLVRLSCEAPACVFYEGEPVQVQAQFENPGSEAVAGRLEAVVCDWLGQEQRHALGELRLAPGQTHKRAYEIPLKQLGSYTLWLRLADSSGAAEGRQRVAVSRRRPATAVDTRSPMGMGLYLPRIRDDAQLDLALALAREAGVKWTRADLRIADCRPEPNQWVWDRIQWRPSPHGRAIDVPPHSRLEVVSSESLNRPCTTGELTIAFRLRLTTLDYPDRWRSLLRKSEGSNRQWFLYWDVQRRQFGLSLGDGKSRWTDCLSSKTDWEVGRWYEIVVSHRRADRSVRWWVDGQPAGATKAGLAETLAANAEPMFLGGGLKATLDDLAIHDRCLEPVALAAAKPVAHWTFDEGRALQADDRSGNQNHIQAKPWRYDGIFARTQEQGISTYCIFMGTPEWMAAKLSDGQRLPRQAMPRLADWSATLETCVARQMQAGIHTWEIWNEPNIPAFWSPEPNPEDYTQLLIASYKAIKKVDPQATVLGCSLAGPTGRHWPQPYEFVEAILKLGAGQAMDAISIHPYRQPRSPEESGYRDDIQAISDLTAKYGRRLPIWITEVGWPTDAAGSSESRSARFLVRAYLLAIAQGVQNVTWYDYRDDGVDPTYNEHHFGILYNDLTPKPSYFAYRTMATELAGLRFEREVPAGDGVSVLLFGDGQRHTAVAWSHHETVQLGIRVGDRRRLETVDLMGNPKEVEVLDGAWLVAVDESAVFLRDMPASLSVVRPIETVPSRLKLLPGENRSLELTIRNPFSGPMVFQWTKEKITLAPGGEKRITVARTSEAWAAGPIEPWRSANGIALTVPTEVVMLEGRREPILHFDAETTKTSTLPDSSSANVTDEVTVAARFRSRGPTGTWEILASKWAGPHRNWGVFLGREKGDLCFSASFAKGLGAFSDVSSGHSLFDGQWHRIAVTYSAHDAEVCFYVDGKLVRRVPRDGGKLLANQGPVHLAGGFSGGRAASSEPQAALSHLRVWSRALSAKEIAELDDPGVLPK